MTNISIRQGRLCSLVGVTLASWVLWACNDGAPKDAHQEEGPMSTGGSPASGGSSAGGTASSGGTSSTDDGAVDPTRSSTALEALMMYLSIPSGSRPPLIDEDFASVPLTAADASKAAELLWEDHADWVRSSRAEEMGATKNSAKAITVGEHSLLYYMSTVGDKPATGWDLFIGMHGGGNTTASDNDSQWENHMSILEAYQPKHAIIIAPRAPVDAWNMWFVPQVDELFAQLIENLIAFEGVNPNRVYLTGYSAGGDGTYQLGPRMADYWAGAGMSAGHPNDASPESLRNVPFAIHVGGDDTAYDRNIVAADWGAQLDALHDDDPGGYFVQWQVHEGLPHWMDLAEKVSIPFLEQYTRDPISPRVVWKQAGLTKSRSYWLSVNGDDAEASDLIVAEYSGQNVTVSERQGVTALTIRLRDAMMSLDEEVVITDKATEVFRGFVSRTIGTLYRTLEERHDPDLMFSAEVALALD